VSPRALEESMRPRLQSSAYARPLNFTVSSHLTGLDMPTRLWCFSLVLALHSVISAGAGSLPNLHPKPLAMPEGVAAQPRDISTVTEETQKLEPLIGHYPPRYRTEEERQAAYTRWSGLLSEARALRAASGDTEPVLALLSNLARQGHNIDVSDAGTLADTTLTLCIEKFPESVSCHTAATLFYLQVDPALGIKAERSLLFLRAHYAPAFNEDVERGFVYFDLYQRRNAEAIKQIDNYLAHAPQGQDHALFEKLRAQLISKGIETVPR